MNKEEAFEQFFGDNPMESDFMKSIKPMNNEPSQDKEVLENEVRKQILSGGGETLVEAIVLIIKRETALARAQERAKCEDRILGLETTVRGYEEMLKAIKSASKPT